MPSHSAGKAGQNASREHLAAADGGDEERTDLCPAAADVAGPEGSKALWVRPACVHPQVCQEIHVENHRGRRHASVAA